MSRHVNSWSQDLPVLLHDVYGTLFGVSQSKVNKFGLLHCSELVTLFPRLDPAMLKEVLISLEFCIQINPLLLKEELLQLTIDECTSLPWCQPTVQSIPEGSRPRPVPVDVLAAEDS